MTDSTTYPLELITYDWLKANDFRKLDRLERQPSDHYRRCLGNELIGHGFLRANDDICLDVAPDRMEDTRFWYVWITRASSQNNHPSIWIHARHMVYTGELIMLYEAITGRRFGRMAWSRDAMPDPLFPTTDPFRR